MKQILILSFLAFLTTACSSSEKKQNVSGEVVKVTVNEDGYSPSEIEVPEGQKNVRIEFTRTTDSTCAREVVSKDQGVNQKLPLNKPVTIDFNLEGSKTVAFGCHMNMMHKGVIVRK